MLYNQNALFRASFGSLFRPYTHVPKKERQPFSAVQLLVDRAFHQSC